MQAGLVGEWAFDCSVGGLLVQLRLYMKERFEDASCIESLDCDGSMGQQCDYGRKRRWA